MVLSLYGLRTGKISKQIYRTGELSKSNPEYNDDKSMEPNTKNRKLYINDKDKSAAVFLIFLSFA